MSPEQTSLAESIQIVQGNESKKYIDGPTMKILAQEITDNLRDTPDINLPRIRAFCRALLCNVLTKNMTVRIYPYHTDWETFPTVLNDIKRMLNQGTLLTAIKGKSVVGIGGYDEMKQTVDGAAVIELRRTVVQETFRGMGIYKKLADERLQEVESVRPDAIVISATRQPSVKRWCLDNGFSQTHWEHFYKTLKNIPFSPCEEKAFDKRVKEGKWTYYMRMPSSTSQSLAECRSA